ncbi:MAG: hypothetical protein HDS13_07225 [Bacteroides sp.]|nr:hypothetical protein [Bacteroides sp.]
MMMEKLMNKSFAFEPDSFALTEEENAAKERKPQAGEGGEAVRERGKGGRRWGRRRGCEGGEASDGGRRK